MLITCIVGLPGSGKTHLMDEISSQYPPLRAWAVDDISELGQLPSVHAVHDLDHLIIADPHFCRASTRVRADALLTGWYNRPIEWIFFANNPQQCRENVMRRQDDRKVLGMIHILSELYTIPDGAEVRPVWQTPLENA